MWFRALRPYRLPNRLGIDAEELERPSSVAHFLELYAGSGRAAWGGCQRLMTAAFRCWFMLPGLTGWCGLKREEKLLPATVVREQA
jgi:DNA recombination-dependent growth factor C